VGGVGERTGEEEEGVDGEVADLGFGRIVAFYYHKSSYQIH
jgi:hypothetical protein